MSKTIHVRADNQARIVCDCGRTKNLDLSQHAKRITEARVKCQCGRTYLITFDYRQQYRKSVNLYGKIVLENKKTYDVQIIDISMTGINLDIVGNEYIMGKKEYDDIRIGDYVHVIFKLNDANRTNISRTVEVRRVKGKNIGAQFCDNAPDKNLGFYLLQ
jgi:hypothetical protein